MHMYVRACVCVCVYVYVCVCVCVFVCVYVCAHAMPACSQHDMCRIIQMPPNPPALERAPHSLVVVVRVITIIMNINNTCTTSLQGTRSRSWADVSCVINTAYSVFL